MQNEIERIRSGKNGFRFIDLTGQRFGKLVAIKPVGQAKGKQYLWECICDCGNTSVAIGSNLIRGNTKACGCVRLTEIGDRTRKHGMSKTRIFNIWAGMRKRCLNPKCKAYKNYGGRGIKIDPRWDSFENFYEDVHESYADNLSLDRYPDINGDYGPSNFRWATQKTQNNNRRTNVHVELDGESKTLAEWSNISGVHPTVIKYRLKNNWSVREAIFKATPKGTTLESISQYLVF